MPISEDVHALNMQTIKRLNAQRDPLSITAQEIQAWITKYKIGRLIQTQVTAYGKPKQVFIRTIDENITGMLWGESWEEIYAELGGFVLRDEPPFPLVGGVEE